VMCDSAHVGAPEAQTKKIGVEERGGWIRFL
jgi:hypothetical protein